MAQPDPIAKEVFETETPTASGACVRFEVPPEVPVGPLSPDGVMRVVDPVGLVRLPPPWNRLRHDATVEIKMPGDHTDRVALARAELRRQARYVRTLEAPTDPAAALPSFDPRDYACWMVAPHLPRWIREDADAGMLTLDAVTEGCWRLGPRPYDLLWIAANALPLHAELIPLLIARSGKPLVEFLDWAIEAKGPAWVAHVVQHLSMDPDTSEQYRRFLRDPEAQRRMKIEMFRSVLDAFPEVVEEVVGKSIEKGIEKGIEQGVEQGVGRGRLEGLRHGLVALLHARGFTLSPEHARRIEAADSVPLLDAWIAAAVTAPDPDAVFRAAPPPAGPPPQSAPVTPATTA
jgi:hypothetical protein